MTKVVQRIVATAFMLSMGTVQTHAGTLELTGSVTQGGLVVGLTEPDARISLDGRAMRVSKEGLFLLGFGRDAAPQSQLVASFADGTTEQRTLAVERRQYDIQRIDGLPPRKVSPNERDLKRIQAESSLVKRARERDDPRVDFAAGFTWPAKGRISGVYGSQRILNGEPRRPHFGIDIAAPVGTTVTAPADGLVTLAHPDMFFSGGTLIVDHGHGLSSTFIHLSRILVAEGVRVKQGDPIAEIGATGRATGPHLDWRMNLFEHRLDPQLLVGPIPED